MNARGEQMQENENLKADLLGKMKLINGDTESLTVKKDKKGKTWEEWQHFFWMLKLLC